ncbi:LamG domain-containing protein [Flagellimonas meishanensis]|uniref:LamG domain-containing protein n=1 Tax=Flagellimonas meishanensis TaxID=2873264 RepID=UPI001CA703DB|nr:LamG domain-containing protein [[Muricauda] meishanensis]
MTSKQLGFKTEHVQDPSPKKKTTELNIGKQGFTLTFWLQSRNNSRNGILVTLHERGFSGLKNSFITLLVSKERISLLSGKRDYRKIHNEFGNYFSKSFLDLPHLNPNEKYFVSCTYTPATRTINVMVDGESYFEQVLEAGTPEGPVALRMGYATDNSVNKYFFKGQINQFYLFNELLDKKEQDLLMNLTLTENYPLPQ